MSKNYFSFFWSKVVSLTLTRIQGEFDFFRFSGPKNLKYVNQVFDLQRWEKR